jgi:hypothetical protein
MAARPPALLDLGRYPGDGPAPPPRIHEPEGRDAMSLPTATAFVGIDVAKDILDACLLLPGADGARPLSPTTLKGTPP